MSVKPVMFPFPGDQCFFSLLTQDHPELFHPLPCEYNYQLDVTMNNNLFRHIFHKFHSCREEPKIFHGNGGTPIPDEDDEFFWSKE